MTDTLQPWLRPEPLLCPTCGLPAVRERHLPPLPIQFSWTPHFDREGRRHTHDLNGTGTFYLDAQGHAWQASPCWCGWKGSEDD